MGGHFLFFLESSLIYGFQIHQKSPLLKQHINKDNLGKQVINNLLKYIQLQQLLWIEGIYTTSDTK